MKTKETENVAETTKETAKVVETTAIVFAPQTKSLEDLQAELEANQKMQADLLAQIEEGKKLTRTTDFANLSEVITSLSEKYGEEEVNEYLRIEIVLGLKTAEQKESYNKVLHFKNRGYKTDGEKVVNKDGGELTTMLQSTKVEPKFSMAVQTYHKLFNMYFGK